MIRENTLVKKEILRGKKAFTKVFAEGRRIRGEIGQLIILPWYTKQVAFVVGKKCGNALTRNRLRRYLRNFYRTHKSEVPDNHAVVFQLFPRKQPPTFQQVQNEFSQLCKNL